MPETELQISLYTLQQKLKLLVDKHSVLKKENERLQADIANVQNQLVEKDEQIKKLSQQAALAKSGIQQWHPEQKKLFVKRIDTYLKEIEKCLALINE